MNKDQKNPASQTPPKTVVGKGFKIAFCRDLDEAMATAQVMRANQPVPAARRAPAANN